MAYPTYSSYRDSGVAWLGEVPSHWGVIQFRRVVESIKDGTHGTHTRENSGFPFLSAKNVFNDGIRISDNESCISEEDFNLITGNGFPRKNDLLITCVGSIGRSCVYPFNKPIAFQRSVAFLRLNSNGNPKYYKYFVESDSYQSQLKAHVRLSIQGGVYLGTLIGLLVCIPPLAEQTAIADYLDTQTAQIDALIDKQQNLLAKLAEQRSSVITQAVTRGLNPNAPMKDSGVAWLGEVPKHWDVSALKFYYDVQLGKMLQPKQNSSDDFEIPYLKAIHVQWDSIQINNLPLMWANPQEVNKFLVKNGDLLICEGGEVGRCSILSGISENTIIQNALHRVRESNKSTVKYLDYVIQHTANSKWFSILCNKATIAHLTSEKLINLSIPLPPLTEQTAIADYLDEQTAHIDRLSQKVEQAIGRLKEYRTALITQAVTGKIKVITEG